MRAGNFLLICHLLILSSVLTAAAAVEISGNTQEEISRLAVQLNDYRTIYPAYERLKQMAESEQSAILPMIRLFSHKQADTGPTHEVLGKINSYLQKYFHTHKADPTTISVLLDTVQACADKNNRWYGTVAHLLNSATNDQVLTEQQIERLVNIAEIYMQPVRTKQTTAYHAVHIMQVVVSQGKYHKYPENVMALANEFLQSNNAQAQTLAVEIFASQLYYRDSESKKIIVNIIFGNSSTRIRNKAITAWTVWLKTSHNPDEDVKRLLPLLQSNQYPESRALLEHTLLNLVDNPNLTNTIKAQIYTYVNGTPDAGNDYLTLLSHKTKMDKNRITDPELQALLRILQTYHSERLGVMALNLLMEHQQRYGFSATIHQDMMLAALEDPGLISIKQYKELVVNSVPYSYLQTEIKPEYPRDFIFALIVQMQKTDNDIVLPQGMELLTKIKERQALNREVISELYRMFATKNQSWLRRKLLSDFLMPYYRETGYLDLVVLENNIDLWDDDYSFQLSKMYLAHIKAGQRGEPVIKLHELYRNKQLPEPFRLQALGQLIALNFDYAQKNILPPLENETDHFKIGVWQYFVEASSNGGNKVNKQKLLDATRNQNHTITMMAWYMLEKQGVRIPLTVKLADSATRKEMTFTTLLATTAIALLLSIFLYMSGGGKTPSVWRVQGGVVRVLIWIVVSLGLITFDALVILGGGLSHSGYPYGWVNPYLFMALLIYLGIGLILRIFISVITRTKSRNTAV